MKKVLFILICLFCCNNFLLSQDNSEIKKRPVLQIVKNPIGSEYYICFMRNYQDLVSPPNPIQLKLFITALDDANVKIQIPSLKYVLEIFIPKNTTQQVVIPKAAQILKNFTVLEGFAIHVLSDNPIFLYGLNTRNQTSDTYLAFPISTLGTRYRVMSYTTADARLRDLAKPEMAITSPFDSTIVKIIPTMELEGGIKAGDTLKIRMNRGDVYQVSTPIIKNKVDSLTANKWDLTGSLVISSKPIAVWGGHECAFVPVTMPDNTCNHLVEQMPPTASWGKHFFVGKLAKRTTYNFRILADKDSTSIFVNNKNKVTLNAGQFFDGRTDQDLVISADKPILVAQFSEGFRNGDNIGDPMMLLLPPTNQFLSNYSFATPKDGQWNHFINVIVPTASIKNLTVDGKTPMFMDSLFIQSPTYFSPQPLSGHAANKNIDKYKLVYRQLGLSLYSIATIQIPYGPHQIACTKPFGMYSYGFGFGEDSYDAYGTMGGQTFQEFEYAPDKDAPYIKTVTNDNEALELVIHEDRENDSGIASVEIKESLNIDFEPFTVPMGIAQLKIKAFALSINKPGRAIISVKDQVGNEELYTICFIYNTDAGRYIFEFDKSSVVTCSLNDWYAGLFGRVAQTYNYINFSNSGNINSIGKFSDAISVNGVGGAYISYRFKPSLGLTGKLFFENLNANLIAPYPELSYKRNPISGNLDPVQEMDRLKLNSLYMNLSVSAEWYFDRRLYLTGGLNLNTKLYDKVTLTRETADPGFKYDTELRYQGPSEAFNTFGANLFGGVGFASTLPFYNEYASVFIEVLYDYYLTNQLKTGSWRMNQLALNFGLKYNF